MNPPFRIEHGQFADPDDATVVRAGCSAVCSTCDRKAVVCRESSIQGRRLIAAGFATAAQLARAAVRELVADCPSLCGSPHA